MIKFDRVSKYYKPDIIALKDVSFGIETGEFMFLTGPSGAGKSTLIRLLIRQELPSEGSIVFDDTDVVRLKRNLLPYYRQQIGVVFQDYKLIETKTICENIEFSLEITGKSDKEIRDTTDSLLEIVGLQKRRDLFPSQLSGGEKQRAGIARALANDPKLLIADEPTGNLDPKTSFEIMDILKTINNWGTTVMIATHDKDIVDAMKKRIVRIEDGQMVSDRVGGYNGDEKEKTSDKKSPSSAKEVPLPKIEALDLPMKVAAQLKKNNITSIDTLLDMSEEDLVKLEGIGEKKAQQIIAALESFLTATAADEKK